MEMHQIRYFLAVSRTLNFTKAAEECHVAQPSLSRAIKKLEEELGGDLFRRERSLTHPTELGRMMMPVLARCYESAVNAKELAKSYQKGSAAPLRLALSLTINLDLIAAPLNVLVRGFPDLNLNFFRGSAGEVAEELKTGQSELAVAGVFEEEWDRFDRWPLFTEPLSLVVNKKHPFAARRKIEMKRLKGERLLHRPYCETTPELSEILAAKNIPESSGDRIVSDHDLLSLLEANVGVAIAQESVLTSEKLVRVAVEGLNLERTVFVYAVSGRERTRPSNILIKLLRASDWPKITTGLQAAA
jgi:DNA-binding transcriptional LysR family regulator